MKVSFFKDADGVFWFDGNPVNRGDIKLANAGNGLVLFKVSFNTNYFDKPILVQDVLDVNGASTYTSFADIINKNKDFFADAALAAAEQLSVDLGVETQNRIDGDANLQNQVNTVVSGYLGSVAYNAAAPTPAKNGWYDFSTGGVVSWLAGTPTVKIGDRVSVLYTSPSTYVYTYQNINFGGGVLLYNDIENLNQQILSKDIINWDWNAVKESSAGAAGYIIIPTPIRDGFLKIKMLCSASALTSIKLYTKNANNTYSENKTIYSFNAISGEIRDIDIIDKIISNGVDMYIGISNCKYVGTSSSGSFILVANNNTYKGLCVTASLSGTIQYNINFLNKLEESVSKTNEYLDSFIGEESWIKVQGNKLDSSDYSLTNASIDSNKITLQSINSRVVLNSEYWSDRRKHRIILSPTVLGSIDVNLCKDTANTLYSDMTAAGKWTSHFRIDMINNKLFINTIQFDTINFISNRKYVIDLKYIRRVFYVTISDFITGESITSVLDSSSSNKNGAFKKYLTIVNVSGEYNVFKIESYEIKNPLLVLFGDSVTEPCGRVGQNENFSEIIYAKYRSTTIVAQGGGGAGNWDSIFNSEIKYIKPKYCSFNMGLNGGVTSIQLQKFISDCISIGTIPILNRIICYDNYQNINNSDYINAIIENEINASGYRGYYADIATAQNNDTTDKTNYVAVYDAGKYMIKRTAMSTISFTTYNLPIGTIVTEEGVDRTLTTPLTVILDIHPNKEGHLAMANRFFLDITI